MKTETHLAAAQTVVSLGSVYTAPDCGARICFLKWKLRSTHDGIFNPEMIYLVAEGG